MIGDLNEGNLTPTLGSNSVSFIMFMYTRIGERDISTVKYGNVNTNLKFHIIQYCQYVPHSVKTVLLTVAQSLSN